MARSSREIRRTLRRRPLVLAMAGALIVGLVLVWTALDRGDTSDTAQARNLPSSAISRCAGHEPHFIRKSEDGSGDQVVPLDAVAVRVCRYRASGSIDGERIVRSPDRVDHLVAEFDSLEEIEEFLETTCPESTGVTMRVSFYSGAGHREEFLAELSGCRVVLSRRRPGAYQLTKSLHALLLSAVGAR